MLYVGQQLFVNSLNNTKNEVTQDLVSLYLGTISIKHLILDYAFVEVDCFYNRNLKCNAKLIKGGLCSINIAYKASREGRTTCSKHIGKDSFNPLFLLQTEILKHFDPDTVNYNGSLKHNYRGLIVATRKIQRMHGNRNGLWYFKMLVICLWIARETKDIRAMRYLLFTVDFRPRIYECSRTNFVTKFCVCANLQNCGLNMSTPYTNKDILFGLLLKYGTIHENLPRELIIEIFNTLLFLEYPGTEYAEKQLRLKRNRKNEERAKLIEPSYKRHQEHLNAISSYNESVNLITNKKKTQSEILKKDYEDKLELVNAEFRSEKMRHYSVLAKKTKQLNLEYPELVFITKPFETVKIKLPKD